MTDITNEDMTCSYCSRKGVAFNYENKWACENHMAEPVIRCHSFWTGEPFSDEVMADILERADATGF